LEADQSVALSSLAFYTDARHIAHMLRTPRRGRYGHGPGITMMRYTIKGPP